MTPACFPKSSNVNNRVPLPVYVSVNQAIVIRPTHKFRICIIIYRTISPSANPIRIVLMNTFHTTHEHRMRICIISTALYHITLDTTYRSI